MSVPRDLLIHGTCLSVPSELYPAPTLYPALAATPSAQLQAGAEPESLQAVAQPVVAEPVVALSSWAEQMIEQHEQLLPPPSSASTATTPLRLRMEATEPERLCIDCAQSISDGSMGPKCQPCKKAEDAFVGGDEPDRGQWHRGLWQDRMPAEAVRGSQPESSQPESSRLNQEESKEQLTSMDSYTSMDSLLDAFQSGLITVDALRRDMKTAFLQMPLVVSTTLEHYKPQLRDVAEMSILEVARLDAESSGLSHHSEEASAVLGAAKKAWGDDVQLPSLQGNLNVWELEDAAAVSTQRRLCLLLLSDIEGLRTLLRRLPPNTHSAKTGMHWTYLSTAHLHIKKDGSVLEHALSVTSLMPHDQCTSPLSLQEAIKEKGLSQNELLAAPEREGWKGKWMTLHARSNLLLVPFVRDRIDSPAWLFGYCSARHALWRVLLLLRCTNGQYYVDAALAKDLFGSDKGAGVHAFLWWAKQRDAKHITAEQCGKAIVVHDDAIPLCLHEAQVRMKGVDQSVNTGQMDDWLRQQIQKHLRHNASSSKEDVNWLSAVEGQYARSKSELTQALSWSLHLRETGLTAPAPSPIHFRMLNCTGEDYLIRQWNEHTTLTQMQGEAQFVRQDSFLHFHQAVDDRWICRKAVQSIVLDTLFTANHDRGNLYSTRAAIMLHGNKTCDGRVACFLIAHKFKPGENGHWPKNWLLGQNSQMEEGRGTWAPRVGVIGVALLASPLVGGDNLEGMDSIPPAFQSIAERLEKYRKLKLHPLRLLPYEPLVQRFPAHAILKKPQKKAPASLIRHEGFNGLFTKTLMTCSFHGNVPVPEHYHGKYRGVTNGIDPLSDSDSDAAADGGVSADGGELPEEEGGEAEVHVDEHIHVAVGARVTRSSKSRG